MVISLTNVNKKLQPIYSFDFLDIDRELIVDIWEIYVIGIADIY